MSDRSARPNRAFAPLRFVFPKSDVGDGFLYHYTDTSGLIGIASSRCIRASLIDVLNDAQEVLHSLEIIKKQLRALAPDEGLQGVLDLNSETALHSEFEDRLDTRDWFVNFYVACFSKDGDSLGQWKGYGAAGGGYSLGFDCGALASLEDPVFPMSLRRVIYDTDEQARMVQDRLEPVLKTFRKKKQELPKDDVEANETVFSEALATLIIRAMAMLPLFKHEGWKEEEEWRLVIHYPTASGSPDAEKLAVCERTEFRAAARSVSPYVEIDLSAAPLRDVVQGPAVQPGPAKVAADLVLKCKGHDITVRPSKIQMRP